MSIKWHAIKVVDADENRSTSYQSDDDRYRIDPNFRAAERGPNGRIRDGYNVSGCTVEGQSQEELGWRLHFETLAEAKERCERDDPNERRRS
jgi:hypothetical protein